MSGIILLSRGSRLKERRDKIIYYHKLYGQIPSHLRGEIHRIADEIVNVTKELEAIFSRATSCNGCSDCCCKNYDSYFTDEDYFFNAVIGASAYILGMIDKLKDKPKPRCIFLSEDGCSLKYVHRPHLCIEYICGRLERELKDYRLFSKTIRLLNERFSLLMELLKKGEELRKLLLSNRAIKHYSIVCSLP